MPVGPGAIGTDEVIGAIEDLDTLGAVPGWSIGAVNADRISGNYIATGTGADQDAPAGIGTYNIFFKCIAGTITVGANGIIVRKNSNNDPIPGVTKTGTGTIFIQPDNITGNDAVGTTPEQNAIAIIGGGACTAGDQVAFIGIVAAIAVGAYYNIVEGGGATSIVDINTTAYIA